MENGEMRVVPFVIAIVVMFQQNISSGQGWWYGGYGGRHASTVAEGYARGMADVVRSAGAANVMNSEAAVNYETARRQNIENRVAGTQAYFEMRRINREARAAERGPRPTQEDLIRYSNARKPKRLSQSEVDPLTGGIAWPGLLRSDTFKDEREGLDKIYAARAKQGYLNADQIMAVDQLMKSMQNRLKANLDKYPPQLYTQAKSFMTSLAYESFLQPS
jgi:hypothetical protein